MEQEQLPEHAQDIRLQLHTTRERGWPQDTYTIDNLVTGIDLPQRIQIHIHDQ